MGRMLPSKSIEPRSRRAVSSQTSSFMREFTPRCERHSGVDGNSPDGSRAITDRHVTLTWNPHTDARPDPRCRRDFCAEQAPGADAGRTAEELAEHVDLHGAPELAQGAERTHDRSRRRAVCTPHRLPRHNAGNELLDADRGLFGDREHRGDPAIRARCGTFTTHRTRPRPGRSDLVPERGARGRAHGRPDSSRPPCPENRPSRGRRGQPRSSSVASHATLDAMQCSAAQWSKAARQDRAQASRAAAP